MTSRRRLAPVVLAAALLAACGGNGSGSSSPSTATTNQAGAGGGGPDSVEPQPASPTTAGADATTVAPPLLADYRAAGELPELGGTATIWAWRPGAPATREMAAALAATLGIDEEVTDSTDGDGYTAGQGERSLWVRADAQGYWAFSGADANVCRTEPSPSTLPAVGPMSATEPCTPPRGVPSPEDAESIVRAQMEAIGLDPDEYAFTATPQDDEVWVEAPLVVDSLPTDVTTTFAVGDGGTITYGAGQLLAPQPIGTSTLIGTEAAFDRLRSDFLWRVYSPVPGAPDVTAGPPPTAAGGALPVVTIVSVERDWWTHRADDGTVTLFPAYTFLSDAGDRTTVPAVPDDQLPPELRPATTTEPAPGG